jgi:kinesin family protein 20
VGSTLGAGPSGHNESGIGGGRESESFVMVEEELEVVEEPDSDTEEEDDETDVLVDSLFEQLREMKTRVSTAFCGRDEGQS